MSKEEIFRELIAEMCKDGHVSDTELSILISKGNELGLTENTVKLMLDYQLSGNAIETNTNKANPPIYGKTQNPEEEKHIFKSAITRGGSILTPDIIVIEKDNLTYRKRNKYLLNVDSTSMKISNISSIELDTSLLGTDIIIKSFGEGTILCKKFSLRDARKIKKLIQNKQKQ